MKKMFFVAIACGCMAFASCDGGFKSQKYQLTDEIFAVSSLSEAGDTLMSVQTATGEEIIPPTAGVRFSTDRDYRAILMAIPNDGSARRYYTLKGDPITDGTIKGFKAAGNFDELVFIGKAPSRKTVLYFPGATETILANGYALDSRSATLGYQTEEGFLIRSLKAEETATWTVKEKDFYFVTFPSSLPRVVVPGKRTATVYKTSGEKDKDIPIAKWNQTLKSVKNKTKAGAATVIKLEKDL